MSGNAEESTKKCPPNTQCFTWNGGILSMVGGARFELATNGLKVRLRLPRLGLFPCATSARNDSKRKPDGRIMPTFTMPGTSEDIHHD